MAERDLIIRLLGDASSLIRSVRSSSTQLKSIGVSAQSSARLQIEASLKKDARLRQEASAYRAAAAAAARGSREQVVAANLADRANAKLARSLGVTSAESRAFARSAGTAERDLGRATRGALAGSGVFRGLGRSIAFASGGFLAFASAGQFVRTSIDAAREAAVSQAQLAAQLRSSGKNFTDYRDQIEKSNLALGALAGFQNDELDASFTTIFRSTKDVTKTLRDEALAADIARGRHISLAAASTIVAKTEAGNVGILRRAGLQIAKNATVEQALAVARARFAGQARAGTTAQERFGAVLHDTEEIIGAGLLPTLDRYLNKSTAWLSQSKNQERIQRDVAATTKTVGDALQGVKAVLSPVVSGLRILGKVSGGTENEVKLLGAAFLVFKTRASLVKWGVIGSGIEGIGAKSLLASGEVEGLGARLGLLADINPIAIPITILFIDKHVRDSGKKLAEDILHPFNTSLTKGLKDEAGVVKSISKFVLPFGGVASAGAKAVAKSATPDAPNPFAPSRFGSGDLGLGALTKQARTTRTTPTTTAVRQAGLSLQGRFNLDQLALAKAQASADTALQRQILTGQAAILKAQAASAKTLKERTGFYQQLAGIEDQIRGIDSQALSASKKTATAAKKAAAVRKKLADSFATSLPLQVADARAQALGLDEAPILTKIKTAAQKALKSGRLGLQGQIDAWNQIASINDQLKGQVKSALGSFKQLDVSKITAGLTLTVADRKRLEASLSQAGINGAVPNRGVGAFGQRAPDIVVQHTTMLDGRPIEKSVTRHQQKRARRGASQRRGPNAGLGAY